MRPMRPRLHGWIPCVASVVLLQVAALGSARAQAMDLPVETQIPIFLKLLSFDRNLMARDGSELVIAIVYQGGYRESQSARRQAETELRKASQVVEGLVTRVVAIDLEQEGDLGRRLTQEGVGAMYISPLRATDIKSIVILTRAAHIRSFSGVSRYVSQGVAMGVALRGDLPQIIVNLPAAREEGSDYPAQVLKLARVIE
jgi:hypothetical protein